jgi:hypothetical protein
LDGRELLLRLSLLSKRRAGLRKHHLSGRKTGWLARLLHALGLVRGVPRRRRLRHAGIVWLLRLLGKPLLTR